MGQLVLEKAAVHLTPVTLELGGKSPCIVDETADLKLAARRLVFGKYLNSGQTCVAPDYLLVQKSVKEPFLNYVKMWIHKMLGKNPLENPNYPKMINEKHYHRMLELIKGEAILEGDLARKRVCGLPLLYWIMFLRIPGYAGRNFRSGASGADL